MPIILFLSIGVSKSFEYSREGNGENKGAFTMIYKAKTFAKLACDYCG